MLDDLGKRGLGGQLVSLFSGSLGHLDVGLQIRVHRCQDVLQIGRDLVLKG